MPSALRIAVLGAGAWGTALAAHAAARHEVLLWARDPAVAQAVALRRQNPAGLPGFELPDALRATHDLSAALAHADRPDGLIVLATPVAGLRPVAQQLAAARQAAARQAAQRAAAHQAACGQAPTQPADAGPQAAPIVWLCKGIEPATEQLPHAVLVDVLGGVGFRGAVLSGPSFAQEVARGLPVALTAASDDPTVCDRAVQAFHHGPARIYRSGDVTGVELAGAVKNVMAIAAGLSDGMALGHNARAALIARGLAEIVRLGTAMGARADTFMGLPGVGDLVLTCTGDLSRNRRVGLQLAAGEPLDAILAGLGHVAEGVACAQAVRRLAQSHQIDMPIVDAVCAVLDGTLAPRAALAALVAREPRREGAPA